LPTLAASTAGFSAGGGCIFRAESFTDCLLAMQSENPARLRRIVADRLEDLQSAGVLQLPKGHKKAAPFSKTMTGAGEAPAPQETAVAEPPAPATNATNASPEAVTIVQPPMPKESRWQPAASASLFEGSESSTSSVTSAQTLAVLEQEVASCTRCNELASTRTQTVFGVGDPKSRLCFLGEAPGADEDRIGIPFVGRGGQLLTKIIEACRLKREDVYILNMLKCRPPGNRNPLPHELGNCRGFLERQLDLIRPEFICCLGAVASQNLLGTTVAIGKLRGKVHSFRGAKVVCTYHPAFLLRSPSFKKETWEDMKLLMREMGVEL
jgi:uracil-DNA glycosylase